LTSPIKIDSNFREERKIPEYKSANNLTQQRARSSLYDSVYTPIKCLNQFQSDWKIKARVTKKYPLKEWSNQKGSGVLLNTDLIDREGT